MKACILELQSISFYTMEWRLIKRSYLHHGADLLARLDLHGDIEPCICVNGEPRAEVGKHTHQNSHLDG